MEIDRDYQNNHLTKKALCVALKNCFDFESLSKNSRFCRIIFTKDYFVHYRLSLDDWQTVKEQFAAALKLHTGK